MPAKEAKTEEERKERHSADAKSSVKQAAKKDGAGGKYSVGKPGDQDGPAVLDKGDPNYDSEEEGQAKPEPKEPEPVKLTEEEEKEKKRQEIMAKVAAARAYQEFLANLPKCEDFPDKYGKHKFSCDECKCEPIVGFRWNCTKLKDYDICTECLKEMKPTETYTRKNHTGQTRKVTTADFSIAKDKGFTPTDADGKAKEVVKDAKKAKPNDPCPCGSTKKYKKCCGSAAGAASAASEA